jgi:hypothetical protein
MNIAIAGLPPHPHLFRNQAGKPIEQQKIDANAPCVCRHAYREHNRKTCLMGGCECSTFRAVAPPEEQA